MPYSNGSNMTKEYNSSKLYCLKLLIIYQKFLYLKEASIYYEMFWRTSHTKTNYSTYIIDEN